ncbi:D-tyrosyl-tRNA(Tyr) deacylase [Iocasia frigidifontis]|uniref:D-aminoacyl-tRNA deacylase n=1 Tax=Iocasia fonsfrigidae TaxID=2682810 RepID=A0A8A7KEW5_9FIRM|nr:D-aminoacyl-tRNA deacylase [Iocasia fonsfrigidae]QTL98009.1 D-tyrosyl-tRNA(Tyr) deacylase [Iocasia fonsfrigidae]
MRAVIQRVKEAKVSVDNTIIGKINTGLLVFLGVGEGDNKEDVDYLVKKIINLRVFEDVDGKMNLSAKDTNKELLVVSQFTLYGDCRQGRRPSFFTAASPKQAKKLYEYFVLRVQETGLKVESGQFQAMMDVALVNDGPVTLLLDSNKQF